MLQEVDATSAPSPTPTVTEQTNAFSTDGDMQTTDVDITAGSDQIDVDYVGVGSETPESLVASSSTSGSADANVGDEAGDPYADTDGAYWDWVKTTYNGLMERFDGDIAIVTEQMRLMECLAFDNVFGVVAFSDEFVKNFHLASNRPMCGKQIDAVEHGDLTVALEEPAKEFTATEVRFAPEEVVEVIKEEVAAAAAAPEQPMAMPMIDPAFVPKAEETLKLAPMKEALKAEEMLTLAPVKEEPKTEETLTLAPMKEEPKATKAKHHKLCH